VAEPEIAVHMAADLPGGAGSRRNDGGDRRARTRDRAGRSRGAAVRRRSHARRKHFPSPRDPRPRRQGARRQDLPANIGNIVDIVAHVAGTLAAHGEKLAAGDVIITGSIVPPQLIEADETAFAYTLDPLPELSVTFSR
jgi:hypothetical protein